MIWDIRSRHSHVVNGPVTVRSLREAEDNELPVVGRHARERLAEQHVVVSGHMATPAGHDGDVLLLAHLVGDHPAMVTEAVVV